MTQTYWLRTVIFGSDIFRISYNISSLIEYDLLTCNWMIILFIAALAFVN